MLRTPTANARRALLSVAMLVVGGSVPLAAASMEPLVETPRVSVVDVHDEVLPGPVATSFVPTTAVEAPAASPDASDADASSVTGTPLATGQASFYGHGDGFAGRQTANGEIFDPTELTAAHKTLPMGTRLKVTNTATDQSVVVRVNDRGPYAKGRILDLSYGAAKRIGMVQSGHAQVRLEKLG